MDDFQEKAARYIENAEEIRSRVETIKDEKTREIMLQLAADYERLAADCDALAALKIRL